MERPQMDANVIAEEEMDTYKSAQWSGMGGAQEL